MAELKIPQKTLQDNFNLQDFKDDFNALNSEIEENKTLTDSEISRLKEIANTWEAFKNTGGVINGDIKLPRGFALCGTINGNRNALIYQSNEPNDNGRVIVGSSGQTTQIASELRPEVYWDARTHHIILESDYVSDKSQNGYTKFPNGIIMQWGQTTLSTSSGGGRVEVTYPISFPNAPLAQTAQVRSCANDYTATRMTALGRAWRSTMSIFAQQVSGTIVADGSTCTIDWIVFGH